jgi:hypothetical protein
MSKGLKTLTHHGRRSICVRVEPGVLQSCSILHNRPVWLTLSHGLFGLHQTSSEGTALSAMAARIMFPQKLNRKVFSAGSGVFLFGCQTFGRGEFANIGQMLL